MLPCRWNHADVYESIETNSVTPAVCARIQDDPVGEGVGVARRDGGNMVLVSVDDGKNFQRSLLEGIFHRFAYLGSFYQTVLALPLPVFHETSAVA